MADLACPHCGQPVQAMRQQLPRQPAQHWWHLPPLGPTVLACQPDQLPPGIYHRVDLWDPDAQP